MVGTGQNTQDPASFDSSDSNSGAPRVWHVDGNGQRLGDWVAFQPIFHAPLTVLRQLIRRAARLPTDGTSEVPPARALGAFRLNDKQDDGPATVNVEDPLRSLELRLNVWEFDVGKPVFYRVESPFNRTIWSISAYVHRNGAAVRGVIRVRPLRSGIFSRRRRFKAGSSARLTRPNLRVSMKNSRSITWPIPTRQCSGRCTRS